MDSEVLPPEFGSSLLHADRNQCGGGSTFITLNTVPFVARPELSEGSVESLLIEFFLISKTVNVLCASTIM